MAIMGEAPDSGSAAPAATGHARPARRGRWLKWLGLGLGIGPLLLASLLVACAIALGHQLDQPWVKSRIVALVKQHAGLDIDYAGLDVSLFQGVRAGSFSIATPASLAAGSDVFLRIQDLALEARLWLLPFGALHADSLRIGAIELALVSDAAGRDTLSELFPAPPEPEPEPAETPPLSRALADLPPAALERLEIGAIRLRQVELRGARPARTLELASIGVEGALHSGASGLVGSELRAHGAPRLTLELRQGELTRRAELELGFDAHAADAQSLLVELRLALKDQELAPGWPRAAELLALRAALRFAAVPGLTSVELSELRALDGNISVTGRARVFDGGPLRVATSGKAALHLADWPPEGLPRGALPPALAALSLGSLDIDGSARELSWEEERGLDGALEWRGELRELAYDDGQTRLRSNAVTLRGNGTFEGREGRFRARLGASASGRTPAFAAEFEGLELALNGTTRRDAAAQSLDGTATVTLSEARLSGAAGEALTLSGVRLESRLGGTLSGLIERVVPAFDARLALGQVEVRGGGQRARLVDLSLGAELRDVAPEGASLSGFAGTAQLSLGASNVDVFERTRGRRERRALSLRELDGRATLPLALGAAHAELDLAAIEAPPSSLSGLELVLAAEQPLAWLPGNPGAPRVTVSGKLAGARVGASRGALEALSVLAERLDGDRYRLALDATLASLVAGGERLPGRLVAALRADAALTPATLATTASLRGGGSAPRLDAELNARFDRDSERLAYRAALRGSRLGALARLVTSASPDTQQLSVTASGLAASANGELGGVLQRGPGPLPEPAASPLQSLRGRQAFSLALEGIDYRTRDRWLGVPDVSIEVESEHRTRGAGRGQARVRASELSYEGGGSALRLHGIEHALAASFDRPPSQGVIELKSRLNLASATQSWLPAYPIRDLSCTTDLKLDRQLSASLRELTFENPGGGTSLRASGDLELRAEGSPAVTGSLALVGREALSFEGQFKQVFEPLQAAGATARSSGTVSVPFRLESGGLLGYRLLARLKAEELFFATHDRTIDIRQLNGVIPIVEEIALLPGGLVVGASPRGSPLSDARFFDVHPFLAGDNYLTAESIEAGTLGAFGPLAANVRLERTGLLIDQLQVGYGGGQIVGQARIAYRDGNPIVRMRLNATGVRSRRSDDVLDANATLSFEPVALTLDGKLQIVRASSGHVLDMLDILDPYHESTNANRVRSALALGYPKFVRFKLHDGTVDAKVELGGVAQLVRLDEIKAMPLGPVLQRFVAPAFSGLLPARAAPAAPGAATATRAGPDATEPDDAEKTATREP